jgi:hypothetical protein
MHGRLAVAPGIEKVENLKQLATAQKSGARKLLLG